MFPRMDHLLSTAPSADVGGMRTSESGSNLHYMTDLGQVGQPQRSASKLGHGHKALAVASHLAGNLAWIAKGPT